MSLYSLNKDMLVKLVSTIQDDMKKKYEGYHNTADCDNKKLTEFDFNDLVTNLKNSYFFVEANSFSVHALWVMYVDRPFHGCKKVVWGEISRGFYYTYKATGINFNFTLIYGKLVCFYYPASKEINWGHVDEFLSPFWLREDGSKKASNASNFHHCIIECRDDK